MSELQYRYIGDYLAQLRELQNTDHVRLPGRDYSRPGNRACILGMAPLSDFGKLPQSGRFVERYGQAPHAIVHLGRLTVLAVVESLYGTLGEDQPTQRVVSLQHDRQVQIAELRASEPGHLLRLDRQWLGARSGYTDRTVSRTHAVLGPFATSWILQDVGSMNGTDLYLEAGSGWVGGILQGREAADQYSEIPTDIIVPDFVPDNLEALPRTIGPLRYQPPVESPHGM